MTPSIFKRFAAVLFPRRRGSEATRARVLPLVKYRLTNGENGFGSEDIGLRRADEGGGETRRV